PLIPFFVFYFLYLIIAFFDQPLHYLNHVIASEGALEILSKWTEMKPEPYIHVECYHYVTRRTKNGTTRHKRVTFSETFWLKCGTEDVSEIPNMELSSQPLVRLHATFSMFFADEHSLKLHETVMNDIYRENEHRDSYCNVNEG